MSKQPNTVLIGSFVTGALVLAIVGILIVGGGKLFTTKDKFVLFFEGSAKGLNVGAPVAFKGVRIGTVTDVKLLFDREALTFKIMVFAETETEKIDQINGDKHELDDDEKANTLIQAIIARGLRAQLGMQSLVTGLLYVDVDFHPDKPARIVGTVQTGRTEIPTIPSSLEAISKTIESIPVDQMAQKLVQAIEGIERFINSPHSQEIGQSVNGATKEAQTLLHNLNERIGPLVDNMEKTLIDARKLINEIDRQVPPVARDFKETAKQTRQLISNTDKRLGPLATGMEETLKAGRNAAKQAEDTLSTLDKAAGDDSSLRYDLSVTLREVSSAARAVRILADYLERHPEALLKGKGKE